ncbi:hypothetical protein JD524_09570 [Aeromonas caviae]|uniref:hypothetical protein n=1 Tax=Aeromonas caviae TaxID=648 RepID=UPI00191EC5D0|nr:hypothetical protein [Aeromonas caviae]MBL0654861.1 hypothetical protein [Aeromonas caviae]
MIRKFAHSLMYFSLILGISMALPAGYTPISVAQADAWYEGGTLHQANALQWQKASDADKLATCSDLVAAIYKNKSFKPELQQAIKSVDDFRPLAEELVKALNGAFKADPDTKNNAKIFTNQKVPDTAVMLMMLMGWLN